MKRILLTTFAILFGFTVVNAQGTGQIKGTVTDATTGEPLIGVNVGLIGTSIGAPTDIDGNYTINRVPVGSYTLGATSIGYSSIQVEVEVTRGQTLTLNLTLEQVAVEGEEVVVTAQAQGQREAINQQLQASSIVNVVSETKIQELPDFNAAASLSRLPGVSTTQSSGEDNKVVIRGLAPQYNNIQVEGISLASTGSSQIGLSSAPGVGGSGPSNDRSVDLTMVSPYMIRMIEVYKSLTPDQNANSIGGTVNMELREAPSGLHWDAMWQQGYTAKSSNYGNYRAVASVSNRFFSEKLGAYALFNAESYDRDADNLSANYGISGDETLIDSTTGYRPVEVNSVNFNRHIENRNRLGANLILDYKLKNGAIKAVNMLASITSDYTDHNQSADYNSGRFNWNMRRGENEIQQRVHSLKFDYDLDWISLDLSASYTGAKNTLDNSPLLTFNQLADGLVGPRENELPETLADRQASFRGVENVILRTGNLFSNFYEEDRYNYRADIEVPFNVGTEVSGFFRAGGQFTKQITTTDQETPYLGFEGNAQTEDPNNISDNLATTIRQDFGLETNDQGVINASNLVNQNNDLFNPFLGNAFGEIYFVSQPDILIDILNFVIGNPEFDASNPNVSSGAQGGWYDGPYQQLTNDYSYREDYFATYAMSKINFRDLMIIGGVRYEQVDSEYFAYNARDQRNAQAQIMFDTTSYATNKFLLPMVQGKLSPTDWLDFRYSYTQTLARPAYTLLSPKFTITQGNSVITGNPDLVPARSYNHDFNVTFHGNKLGLLSVGVFQKTIEDFVFTANYRLNLGEDAGIDQLSNYQIVCSQALRDRLGDKYSGVAECEDGAQLVTPVINATTGESNANVSRPLNNPNDGLVRGVEVDFQTNLWYLPKPFNSMVFGLNYARIFSKITTPFYDERSYIDYSGRRPQQVFFLADSSFTSRLNGQPNHVLNSYLGYDHKGFNIRISMLLTTNTFNGGGGVFPENNSFQADYLRFDLSARQKLPWLDGGTELFLNVQNLNDVNNESFQRSINGYTNIQNYGLTANVGLRLRY